MHGDTRTNEISEVCELGADKVHLSQTRQLMNLA
jgi:hypothetical protein